MDQPFELEGCNWERIPVPATPIPQGFWENPWRKIDERLLVTFQALCSFCAVYVMGIRRGSSFQTDFYSQIRWCHSPAQRARACLLTWPMWKSPPHSLQGHLWSDPTNSLSSALTITSWANWAAAAAANSLQSCPTLRDPRDGNPPGSPVPGIQPAKLDPTPGPLDLRFPLPGMLLLLICPLLQFSAQSSILTDNLTLQPYLKYHPPPPLFSCLNFFFFMALIYYYSYFCLLHQKGMSMKAANCLVSTALRTCRGACNSLPLLCNNSS